MRLIFTILLIGLFNAEGQIVINASAPYRPFAGLVLDNQTGAAAAYSLRKLRDSYTGSAIRVRKDTTGQPEQDIGFSGNELDTASLKSFLNARNGFVVKWYSQGDTSAIDFEQNTQANQPRIASLGVIDRRNSKPSIIFDGSNDFMQVSSTSKFNYLHNGTDCFTAYVCNFGVASNPNVAYILLDNRNTQISQNGYSLWYDDRSASSQNNTYRTGVGSVISLPMSIDQQNTITPNTMVLITQKIDANNATAANRHEGYVNNVLITTNNIQGGTASTANASANMFLGRISGSSAFFLNGSVSELIIWNSDKSSNRVQISNNINSFYSIY